MKLLIVLNKVERYLNKLGDTMTTRFGVYYAPSTNSNLWKMGCQWLGRDCAKGSVLDHPKLHALSSKELHAVTKSPRRYGFHATLKPPFALNVGQSVDELKAELKSLSVKTKSVNIGQLKLKAIGSFLALVPVQQSEALTELAGLCVSELDHFRLPMSKEARERRMRSSMTSEQTALLDRWGYPYVMKQFRMHMTLTDALDGLSGPSVLKAATNYFASELKEEHILDRICLYEETKPGLPFKRIADFKLLG